MRFHILLVVGIVLAVFSVVAVLTALIEGRRPRVAAIMVLIAGGILALAVMQSDHGLRWEDIPNAFVAVVAAILK